MIRRKAALLFSLLSLSGPTLADFQVHEWGTFTGLVGSNGIVQNGMYHEDEHLPEFVHGFGEVRRAPLPPPTSQPQPNPGGRDHCRRVKACIPFAFIENNIISQKMETPVIYFYSDDTLFAEINVGFPKGVIAETYPAPVKTFPTSKSEPVLANGKTTFQVEVLSPEEGKDHEHKIPFVESDNIYSHARHVESNLVRSGHEFERFIFYRGLGDFQPQLGIRSYKGNLLLRSLEGAGTIPAVFLVHADQRGDTQILNLGPLLPGESIQVASSQIQKLKDHSANSGSDAGSVVAKKLLVQALESSGLFPDEAISMINTWEHGYFKVPGLRLLYILPREETEEILPLKITPTPQELVRVFVGRIEIVLDTEEAKLLKKIETQRELFPVSQLGRFAEPLLRRIKEVYIQREHENFKRPDVQMLDCFEKLIKRASEGEGNTLLQ